MDIGHGEPDDGGARARQPARDQHEQRRHQAQQHEHGGRGADEDRSDAPVIGELDGDARERATDQSGRDDVGPARPCRSFATSSRNSAETGTSWARPSGHSAKAAAVSRPYSSASASSPGCTAGAIGNGSTVPKPQAIRNGKAAPIARPGSAPSAASTSTWVR